MQADIALTRASSPHVEHEEGNMIRLSILDSRKQWDLIGRFCKWIGIFQYIDLFQLKMNCLFNSLLIHYQKRREKKKKEKWIKVLCFI